MKIGGYVESDVSSFIHRMLPNKTINVGKVVNLFMCVRVRERVGVIKDKRSLKPALFWGALVEL